MKILLLTDVPPGTQHTGALVLDMLCRFLPKDSIVCATVINRHLNARLTEDLANSIPIQYWEKPIETLGRIGRVLPKNLFILFSYIFELIQAGYVRMILIKKIVRFARKHQVDRVCAVLQGQTILRLSLPLARSLNVPLYTLVWDPFSLWLRTNNVDCFSQKRLLRLFDNTLREVRCCATASWAMSEEYTSKYKTPNLPIISSLNSKIALKPAKELNNHQEIIIGIAGQIYAVQEWQALISALTLVDWNIIGKKVKIRILAKTVPSINSPVHIELLGWHNQKNTLEVLSNTDLLYLPYWFSSEYASEARLCFPSKLVTYFAAGRPVFFHGPSYASPAIYLEKNKAGFLCTSLDPKIILEKIEALVINKKLYRELANNGMQMFYKDFTLQKMKNDFFHFLNIQEF